jgi:hypothetical protein
MKQQKYGWLQGGQPLTLNILFTAEARPLRLEQQSVRFAKQQQPLCRLMDQAVSTVRLIVASLVLTNYGRTHDIRTT